MHMKRTVVLISLFGFAATGQTQGFFGGLMGGLHFSDMTIEIGQEVQDVSDRLLWGAGGMIGFQIGNHIAVCLEPTYMRMGAVMKNNPSDITISSSVIELPLLLKARFGKRLKPYMVFGPAAAYILTAMGEVEINDIMLETDFMPIIQRFDLGLTAGVGFEIPVWLGSVFIEARYTLGLTNMNEGGVVEFKTQGILVDEAEILEDDVLKNKGFRIMAGTSFYIGAGKERR